MVKNASAGGKAGWSNGRTPLFSQKDLLRLVGPLLIEQFLAVTVGMADTMMVSRCGEAAISGVSLVDMINNLIIVLFAALATGGAVVVSQYLGAKEQEKADAGAGQAFMPPVSRATRIPKGESRRFRFSACWLARISVGASSAA